ncbi:MAG: hypothetical protein ACPGRY_16340 [Candidatus Latescibacterota bacterium]
MSALSFEAFLMGRASLIPNIALPNYPLGNPHSPDVRLSCI